MKITDKIEIGGRTYKVDFPYLFVDAVQPLYGICDDGLQIIRISEIDEHGAKRSIQSIYHTFLHECLHAIDNVYNGGRLTQWEKGEETIDQMAEGIMQLIRQIR